MYSNGFLELFTWFLTLTWLFISIFSIFLLNNSWSFLKHLFKRHLIFQKYKSWYWSSMLLLPVFSPLFIHFSVYNIIIKYLSWTIFLIPLILPSCTATQLHSYTATQLHSYTADKLLHSYTATQLHSYTATQLHSYTAIQLYSYTATQLHSDTAACYTIEIVDQRKVHHVHSDSQSYEKNSPLYEEPTLPLQLKKWEEN